MWVDHGCEGALAGLKSIIIIRTLKMNHHHNPASLSFKKFKGKNYFLLRFDVIYKQRCFMGSEKQNCLERQCIL